MLRPGKSPPCAFPADLIVPHHRGAVITAMPWPQAQPKAPNTLSKAASPAKKRKKSQVKRVRKAAHPKAALAKLALPKAAMPQPAPEPLVVVPPTPEPLVQLAPVAADVPMPRARALVPARKQGLVDVIAHLLRDTGRRLARWSARRDKARAARNQLVQANNQYHKLQSQLEALEALRERQTAG